MQQLLIRVNAADADRVSGLLFDLGVCGLEERNDPEGACFVIYSDERNWLDSIQADCVASLASGPALCGSVEFEHAALDDNYDRAWLDHLGPEWLTADILIRPVAVGSDLEAKTVIVYQPNVAFGTGSHPTTRLAAEAVSLAATEIGGTLLDVGTGNGVLTFVAAKSGCASALGIDIDDNAVAAARVNADLNNLADRVGFETTPLAEHSERYDIVVANIDAQTLRKLSAELCARTRKRLILTGTLTEQRADVEMTFLGLGMQLIRQTELDDWCLLELVQY
jgi:ribosomal protein L11 methyltransferase